MAKSERVHDRIAAVSSELGGSVGVAARDLASQASVCVNADELFPMASCFRIPIMVEVMRRVDAGALRLDDRLTLREADKSPGGALIHCQEGLRPSVRDLLYLMITLSDNTATDMLWRLVGLGTGNETMRVLDLATIDCFIPDCEYSLMQCGAGSDWRGLSDPDTVAKWRTFEARDEREDAVERVLEENARLRGASFQHLYDQRRGLDGSCGYDDAFAIDQARDNPGSPRDMAELLAMIVESRCASGTSSDAAIVSTPSGAPIVMVVYCRGLTHEASGRASQAIAGIATELYEYLGERA